MQVTIPGAAEWYLAQHHWPSEVMYHYTSRAALQNIIQTRAMWATDLRAMNDPRELKHGQKLIDQRLKNLGRKVTDAYKILLQSTHKQFRRLMAERSRSFSISFSEQPDLPHQWRDYAANGTGFVLGWSIDSECPEIPLRAFVTYDRAEQTRLLDGLVQFHMEWLREAMAKTSDPPETFSQAGLSLGMFFNIFSQTTKGPKWAPEREFRYVYQFYEGHEPPTQTFKTRTVDGLQRTYIDADFSRVALRRVVIGPRNDATAVEWLRRLLDENGYNSTDIIPPLVGIEELGEA